MLVNFKSLGLKHSTATLYSKFRETLGDVILKEHVQTFKLQYPDVYQKMLNKVNSNLEPGQRLRGKVQAQWLFDYLFPDIHPVCGYCAKPTGWHPKGRYLEFCCIECAHASSDVVARRKATAQKRFGCEPNLHPKIQAKKKATFMRNYGVDNPSKSPEVTLAKRKTMRRHFKENHWTQTPEARDAFSERNPMYEDGVQDKQEATNLVRYGHTNPGGTPKVQRKIKSTMLDRYGVENAYASKEIQAKIRSSNLEKHGTEFPGCLPKFSFLRKTVEDHTGKSHKVLGYEHHAIKWLDQDTVQDITTSSIRLPKIQYVHGKVKHKYLPDIGVTKQDGTKHLIEVKSRWTLSQQIKAVAAKCSAATDYMEQRGGTFWLFYYTNKLRLIRVKNPRALADIKWLLSEK